MTSSPPPDDGTPKRPGLLGGLRRLAAKAGERTTAAAFYGLEEALRLPRASLFLASRTLEGTALPALAALSEMNRDVGASLQALAAGRRSPADHLLEMQGRLLSGARYAWCVDVLGRELFGTADYPGAQLLAQKGPYRLLYLPPKPGAPTCDAALFFLGGFIPYGDRLFRFLPEANLYDRYLERGIPVYLMELTGDRHVAEGMGSVTMEWLVAAIDEMSETALRHNGGRKLVAQGYCGTGIHLATYLAARPRQAEARFRLAVLFVTPLDAARAGLLADAVASVPRAALGAWMLRSQALGGTVNGFELWAGLDTSLRNVFKKIPAGRFAAGWRRPEAALARSVDGLDPALRHALASDYWTSIANADRWPLPTALVRHALHLYDRGVGPDGDLGLVLGGQRASLAAIASQTSLRVVAFFGGQDKLVPVESGAVLGRVLGPRYRPVFHPHAAHVGYVFFPAQWREGAPNAFSPNPVDVILEELAHRC